MKWTEDHHLKLCGKDLILELFKHPKNSKERGEIWEQVAFYLSILKSPEVSKRSVRLTLL